MRLRFTLAVVGLAASLAFTITPRAVAAQDVTFFGSGTFDDRIGSIPGFGGFTASAFTFSGSLAQTQPTTGNRPVTFTFVQGALTTAIDGGLYVYPVMVGDVYLGGGFQFEAFPTFLLNPTTTTPIYSGTGGNFTYTLGSYESVGDYLDPVGTVSEFSIVSTTVPEPSTYALMAAGLLGVASIARRRRRV